MAESKCHRTLSQPQLAALAHRETMRAIAENDPDSDRDLVARILRFLVITGWMGPSNRSLPPLPPEGVCYSTGPTHVSNASQQSGS